MFRLIPSYDIFSIKESKATLYVGKENPLIQIEDSDKFKHKVLVGEQVYRDNMLPTISVTESIDDEWCQPSDGNNNENVN